jgi:hypothetical protein
LEAGGKQGKGKEPKLCSDNEFSSGDQTMTMPKLPSSSGTTLSSGTEGEKFVDSKERAGSDEGDTSKNDGMRLPILKSYDPNLVSPQELPKTKVATQYHVGDC